MAYSYNDKYKGEGQGRLSVYDILQKVGTTEYTNGVKKEYEAVDIHKVVIGGNTFKNYGAYQFIWEKSFVKSPGRSAGGQLANLPSHATFLTAHLILDFSVMSIDDYRKIMQLHYNANEYTVECYDTIYNRKIKVKMYFATEEMAKLYTIAQHRLLDNGQWQDWVDLVGVTDYKVELIGTNNDLDLVSVKYVYNAPLNSNGDPIYPNGVPDQHEESVYVGEEIAVGANSTFSTTPPNSTYKFKQWKDANGVVYTDQMVVTVNGELTLYAVWEPTTSFTLSFNYGLSDVATEVDENGVLSEVLNMEITNVNDIGKLPPLTLPYIEDKNTKERYYPYKAGDWYKHPVIQENMRIKSNQPYWTNRNTIVYALYEKVPFTVTYFNHIDLPQIPTQTLTYGDTVYLPTLSREGFVFGGWYIDTELKTAFSGTMPPYNITLHAKWEANQ